MKKVKRNSPNPLSRSVTIDARALTVFCASLLTHAGLRADDAMLVADSLVTANLRGTDSHGVARLPHYLRRIAGGSIAPRPRIRVTQRRRSAITIDGGHGLGQLVNQFAVKTAIKTAQKQGAAWIAIRNSSHCGAMAFFGRQLAAANMIGLAFSHVDPMVIPFGSREPFHGTNPICIAMPGAGDDLFCLDMATSIVPWNRIANAAAEGKPIAPNLAVNRKGQPTTDARAVHAIYPFGAHRGSGLGLAIDLLCSMLSNSPFGPHIPKMYGDLSQRRELGGLIGAIDIASFIDPQIFRQRVSQFMHEVRALRAASGTDAVLVPDDSERTIHAQRAKNGVPMAMAVYDELQACGAKAMIKPLEIQPKKR